MHIRMLAYLNQMPNIFILCEQNMFTYWLKVLDRLTCTETVQLNQNGPDQVQEHCN